MNDNNKNESSYAQLRGFHRAMPIILATLAVFVAVCFMTDGVGVLGDGIGALLIGLFSAGAYSIPALLIIHAIFYADDIVQHRVTSRIIFSVITLLLVSVIEYAIVFWNGNYAFSPVEFFKEGRAGGFIGSIVAYALINILGPVGIIILAVALMLVYITYFFSRKGNSFTRALLWVLGGITNGLAAAEAWIKKLFKSIKKQKSTRKIKEAERKNAEFLDDQFFEVDNGMSELKISELGILEEKSASSFEKNPTLQESVRHKSAYYEEPTVITFKSSNEQKKVPDLSYGKDFGQSNDFGFSVADKPLESGEISKGGNDKISFNTVDESADAVFTKDFDPYDFMNSEKMASRKSSKALSDKENSGILINEKPLSALTPEEVEKERRRSDFERRKKLLIEERKSREQALHLNINQKSDGNTEINVTEIPPAEKVLEKNEPQKALNNEDLSPKPVDLNENPSEDKLDFETFSAPKLIPRSVEINLSNDTRVMPKQPTESHSFKGTFDKAERGESDAEQASKDIAEIVAGNNPAYRRNFNPTSTYMQIKEDSVSKTEAEDSVNPLASSSAPVEEPSVNLNNTCELISEYEISSHVDEKSQASEQAGAQYSVRSTEDTVKIEPSVPFVKNENNSLDSKEIFISSEETKSQNYNAENSLPLFKPFTPPIETITNYEVEKQETDEHSILKTERSLLSPTLDARERVSGERDERYTVIEEDIPILNPEPRKDEPCEEVVWKSVESASKEATDDETGTFLSFGDDVAIEDFEGADEEYEDIQSEEPLIIDEIPPEEQNPDVIKMREMFPFLNSEAELTSEDYNDDFEEQINDSVSIDEEITTQDDFDEPPFDVPKPETVALTKLNGLVAEAPKENVKKPTKPDYSSYVFPPIELLGLDENKGEEDIQQEIQDNADKLIDTLSSFNVTASIKGVDRGPRITRYEVVPARGVKTSSVMNLQDDIALNLAAGDIRMEAPIPGKSAIGIEIPNKKATTVRLRELIEAEEFVSAKSKTTVCIGKDVAGQPVFSDISNMPHLLVAGATGMGKSVCINSLMISMLYKARPDEVKFIMIDPKQVEFTMYNGIPHLLVPVVSDAKQAAGSLMWAVEEMERRYNLLNPLCVRNIDAYNDKVTKDPSLGEPMPRIVIVIDEFADLMVQVKDPVENLVMRIAQKARAAGIHLIIGTQRPSVDVITGVIKANIPTRFSCKVASNRDSGTVLDSAGAEKLLNKGDMLLKFANSTKPLRVQGAFVADGEVEDIMAHLKSQGGGASYDSSVMEEIDRAAQKCSKKGSSSDDDDGNDESGEGYLNDKQFLDAVEVAVNSGKISTSLIQRKLSIGYGKAAKFIDIMEGMGIVSEPNGQKPRDVLISADEWYEKLSRISLD